MNLTERFDGVKTGIHNAVQKINPLNTPYSPERRAFLAKGAKALGGLVVGGPIVIDTILGHIPEQPSVSRNFWEMLETQSIGLSTDKLINELEETFRIKIVKPDTGPGEVEFAGEMYPLIEWDAPRLKGPMRVLSDMLPHFYSPRPPGKTENRVSFMLADQPISHCSCSNEKNNILFLRNNY